MLTQQEAFQAKLDGYQIEYQDLDCEWLSVEDLNLLLNDTLVFRILPAVTVANGIEIPLGYQGKMRKGQIYYIPNILSKSFYDPVTWDGTDWDITQRERGLVFLAREQATEYAQAVIRLGGGSVGD